jgi:hypothetical protein
MSFAKTLGRAPINSTAVITAGTADNGFTSDSPSRPFIIFIITRQRLDAIYQI